MRFQRLDFQNTKEVQTYFNELNSTLHVPIKTRWYMQDGLKIYGCFQDKDGVYPPLFIFGQTITPEQTQSSHTNGVFSKLKSYGSSKRYLGLKDVEGNTVLPNIYEDIELFDETEMYFLLEVRRSGKSGLVKFEYPNLATSQNIIQVEYEQLFLAGEYTLGYIKDNKIGFMTLDGKIITEPIYKHMDSAEYNYFSDGRALVILDHPSAVSSFYINHYGENVGYPKHED